VSQTEQVGCEVEFISEEQMKLFKKPDWFGRDITQEDFSANVFLAGKIL
jgi:CYTH domain-containing protein